MHYCSHLSCSALVEKIVAVLPKMKCPYRIEPHQIQGMDFIHIYPVIQVLRLSCSLMTCTLPSTAFTIYGSVDAAAGQMPFLVDYIYFGLVKFLLLF